MKADDYRYTNTDFTSGKQTAEVFYQKMKANDYHMKYNDDLPMTTLNSVANAILPLVLSLLPPAISLYDSVSKSYENLMKNLWFYVFFFEVCITDGVRELHVCSFLGFTKFSN